MKTLSLEEQLFDLLEPALRKVGDRYGTAWGSKTKLGLLSSMRRIIDEHDEELAGRINTAHIRSLPRNR